MKKVRYFTETWALVEEDGKLYMAEIHLSTTDHRVIFAFRQISKRYDEIGDFDKTGVAIVKLNGLYGLINEQGKEICKPQYEGIRPIFFKYFHAYNSGRRSHIIDAQGKIICEYKKIYDPTLCEVAMVEFDNGTKGIINSDCCEIHRRRYDDLDFVGIEANVFKAQVGKMLIIVNINGEEVLELENGKIYGIENGYLGIEANGRYGRMNSKGELIIPVDYEGVCIMKDGIFDAIIEHDRKNYAYRKIQQFDKYGRKIGKEFWKHY